VKPSRQSSDAALREAKLLARLDQFGLSRHAIKRMQERNVIRDDIRHALRTATGAIANDKCWRLDGGRDLGGDSLTVVLSLSHGAVVVTVI
jgi:hypothetical protein